MRAKLQKFGGLRIELLDGMYNANNLLDYYNDERGRGKRKFDYLRSNKTKDYIKHLRTVTDKDLIIAYNGRGGTTYFHELLFLHFVLWFKDPEIYDWGVRWYSVNLIETENNEHSQMNQALRLYKHQTGLGMFAEETALIKSECSQSGTRDMDVDHNGLIADMYLLNAKLMRLGLKSEDRLLAVTNAITTFWLVKDENDRLSNR